jgi:hypothetical protein
MQIVLSMRVPAWQAFRVRPQLAVAKPEAVDVIEPQKAWKRKSRRKEGTRRPGAGTLQAKRSSIPVGLGGRHAARQEQLQSQKSEEYLVHEFARIGGRRLAAMVRDYDLNSHVILAVTNP